MKILAIPGSLRNNSSSNKILDFISTITPEHVDFQVYDKLAAISAFDDSDEVPQAVLHFKRAIKEADVLLICTPEYAFGVPGALKNAIDWTVSSGEFVEKPVALITASSQGEKGTRCPS
ncbi:NADPH-dependent FMN reductase [Solitalea canadensis]|uniref:NADPH-dependent FMN reductase n=1 Tax=Solitalea canadensis TaxID=995 RepID=UPI0002472B14|nr:NADPH-dependent FMN reductase [Solitalea canadensis]